MQPRRTHAHTRPCNRPKASSVRVLERQVYTGPHQPTDSASVNHKHQPNVTRHVPEIHHQKLVLLFTLLLFLLANAHPCDTRPPEPRATASLVRTRPTPNGAHLRRDVRPLRRSPHLLRCVPAPLGAPDSAHAHDANARHARHARHTEGLRADANSHSDADAVHARAKHACGHAESPRRVLPLRQRHHLRGRARPCVIDV